MMDKRAPVSILAARGINLFPHCCVVWASQPQPPAAHFKDPEGQLMISFVLSVAITVCHYPLESKNLIVRLPTERRLRQTGCRFFHSIQESSR